MKNLLTTNDLSADEIMLFLEKTKKYYPIAKDKGYTDELKGKVLAALFYEPSTRTRLSTETAMIRLGGSVINAIGEENSSLTKGETLYDTARVVSNYADIVAIRHKTPGSAAEFATGASVPVVNCGDGSADHPTQALMDAFGIYQHYGRLDNLTVAFVGDLKNSRTTHGLLAVLSKFGGCKAVLCSPPSLPLPDEYKYSNIEFVTVDTLSEAIKGADVIYSSRVQKERFDDQAEYEAVKAYFVFDRATLEQNAPEAILMHALPRIDEILREVDEWPGAKYFDVLAGGVAMRMAILTELLCS